jgi:GT2 family glycosyltransferase
LQVTVIVLSYNGAADTLACLASLKAHSDATFDILVVDNASTDGSPAAIRSRFADVAMICLPRNLGWAGGNNAGIRHALDKGAEMICLLNNDTLVAPQAITDLAASCARNAPCLMHPAIDYVAGDGVQLDPAQNIPAEGCVLANQDDRLFELDFAYGACMMITAELFRRVGLFDERFFLQLEETDLWRRAQRTGCRSLCDTSIRIVHLESRSFGGRATPLKTYYTVRNTLLLTEKHEANVGAFFRAFKTIYWSTGNRLASMGVEMTAANFLTARHPYLIAARAGIFDYLLRRFGPIRPGLQAALSPLQANTLDSPSLEQQPVSSMLDVVG